LGVDFSHYTTSLKEPLPGPSKEETMCIGQDVGWGSSRTHSWC
jgi:hypothetical protein